MLHVRLEHEATQMNVLYTPALERVPVLWKRCRVGKAKRAHQAPRPGGHGAQERAFAHPTSDSSRSKSALAPKRRPGMFTQRGETICDHLLDDVALDRPICGQR